MTFAGAHPVLRGRRIRRFKALDLPESGRRSNQPSGNVAWHQRDMERVRIQGANFWCFDQIRKGLKMSKDVTRPNKNPPKTREVVRRYRRNLGESIFSDLGRVIMRLMFRKWLPHLRCYDSSLDYLDAIGYASSFFYGVGVPCALAYLYTRQHLALLPGKTMVASASEDENLELRLTMVKVSSQVAQRHCCNDFRLCSANFVCGIIARDDRAVLEDSTPTSPIASSISD